MRKGLARGLTVFPLPSDWLQTHILLLAVGIIPCFLCLSLFSAVRSLVSKLLQDMHLGMVEWLAEVVRRREEVMRLAHPASPAITGAAAAAGPPAPSPASQPRHLTVPKGVLKA